MDEAQLLLSRLDDLIGDSEYGVTGYLGFLNEMDTATASAYLRGRTPIFGIFGGYPLATRSYISVGFAEESDYPITALEIRSNGRRDLTHRDFLGSVMGLGIKRECVGDIVLRDSRNAVIFVRNEIADHIMRELRYVGHEPVTVLPYSGNTSELSLRTEELRLIVSSMRLDNFVSACINRSRSDAVEMISSDMVFLNYIQEKKPSHSVSEGDIVSIRGYGKYIVGALSAKTKRDRLVISVLHYI